MYEQDTESSSTLKRCCGSDFSINIDYHADAISKPSMHQIVRGNANDDKSNRPSPLAMFFPAIGYAQRLHTQLTEPRAIETAELVVGFLDCAVTPRPLRQSATR